MATTTAKATEEKMSGFKNGLAWKKVQFRGVKYHLTELTIGDYDEIAKKATKKITRPDGTDYEEIDNQLQSRLMLRKCLITPSNIEINSLGTKLTIALNRVVNELHYGDEVDELTAPDKAAEAEDALDEEDTAPNA
jgi:hypothetical protein